MNHQARATGYNNCIHGIYKGFNRQRFESRGRLENKGTKKTITQVLNKIQKVPETVINLKVGEDCSIARTRAIIPAVLLKVIIYICLFGPPKEGSTTLDTASDQTRQRKGVSMCLCVCLLKCT